jgi:Notch-like protein
MCSPGWAGLYCEQDIPECNSQPCQNGGTCVELLPPQTKCFCPYGFTGTFCEVQISACQSLKPCQNGGLCVNSNTVSSGYTCSCLAGYTGANCEVLINLCNPSPCLNGASCSQIKAGQFVCLCAAGWSGTLCNQQVFPCQSFPCMNNGICTNNLSNSTYTCLCMAGKFYFLQKSVHINRYKQQK